LGLPDTKQRFLWKAEPQRRTVLVSAILAKMPKVGKWQRQFMIHLIPLFMSRAVKFYFFVTFDQILYGI
jgi:hypothetical protein